MKIVDFEEMEDYQKYYLKGYLWNAYPFENKERDENVPNNLIKSISIKRDYIYSKTELSYFYFDKKNYVEVVELLEEIDFAFFEEKGQLWKSLKLQELFLVAQLSLTNEVTTKMTEDFLGLISSYVNIPERNTAVPIELVNGVLENKDKKGMTNILRNLNYLINSKNQRDYFDDSIRLRLESALSL